MRQFRPAFFIESRGSQRGIFFMLFAEAVELFLREKSIAGYSKKTLEFYENATGQLCKIAIKDGFSDIGDLQSGINSFFADLNRRDLSQATIHTYWRATKTFMLWCKEAQYVNDSVRVPNVMQPNYIIRPMTIDQVKKVLRYFNGDSFIQVRNKAMVHMLWDTGLRAGELCGLTEDTLNWDDRWVLVRGKGNKERFVPFGINTRKLLWAWWKRRAAVATPRQRHIFISHASKALDRRAIQMMFRRLKEHFKFPGVRLSAHTFRHTFAVCYIEAGGDPFTLQRILGHATQQMTSRYINVSTSQLLDAHHQYAPGDRAAPGD